VNDIRRSGILLHPTSLPGDEGIGTFGAEARRFVDFLHAAGQSLWQILPLGQPGCGNSPYSCFSAFAGNPLLIDLAQLVAEGDLPAGEPVPISQGDRIDFQAVAATKERLLTLAADRFLAAKEDERKREFWRFCDASFWLHDFALFMALKKHFGGDSWTAWPQKLRQRQCGALAEYGELLGRDVGRQKYLQWQFFRQWHGLKRYANERDILIVGDAPIFVAHDSADVWCNQHIFILDESGSPTVVAGVPPDYFSATGQRWGNPLYDWNALGKDRYGWWVARIRSDLELYDILRIDHFRGFEAYWEIPATEKTAVNGRWVKGPGNAFFAALAADCPHLPIIAEDLGIITREVEELRDSYAFPGMKILQFAFDSGAGNGYLPHNHIQNCVVYTGTHDNDTTAGWFASLGVEQKNRVCSYLHCQADQVVAEMTRAALASVAKYAIIPMQDLLGLDNSGRMNIPGVADGNWGWRLSPGYNDKAASDGLKRLSALYNRNGQQ
jgi:4-alpha-glucanotransferase